MQQQEHFPRHWEQDPWERPTVRRKRRRAPLLFGIFLSLIVLSTAGIALLWHQVRIQPEHDWSWPEPSQFLPADRQEPEEPERAPVGTGVTLPLHSAQGKQPLSYQELYRRCASGVVSVRVEASGGDSLGTGIIMTQDGYVITNCHVVDDCHTVTVVLESGQELPALLVGKDAQTDLAVLKVDASGLTALEFGSSDELVVGDPALAIGNPLGEYLRGTMTDGIISAIDRDISVGGYSMTLIQTTAALNNGNSGGPLLNIYGQVVGINNMKIMSNFSTIEGLGFAIPTSAAKDVVDELIRQGYISRAVLGITCAAVTDSYLARADFEGGLRVWDINPGSAAYDTELAEDDVIVAANGVPIRTMDDMSAVKEGLSVGDILELTVLRGEDETLFLSVPLCDQRDLW